MKIKYAMLTATVMALSTVAAISPVSAEMSCGEVRSAFVNKCTQGESPFSTMYWKCQTGALVVYGMCTVVAATNSVSDDDTAQLNAACEGNPDSSACKTAINQVINKVVDDANKKLPDEIKEDIKDLVNDMKQEALKAATSSKDTTAPTTSSKSSTTETSTESTSKK